MASAITAYLRRSDVPVRKALQQAIDRLGFPLTLDDSYVPLETCGYLPCTLNGEDAGFDLRFKDAAAEPGTTPLLQSAIDDRDVAMSCKWGGDAREEAAALSVCAALAMDFGALVERDGALIEVELLLGQTKTSLMGAMV